MQVYLQHKMQRQLQLRRTVLHLWFRVAIQRPDARRALARALKVWRGGRAGSKKARAKAEDLCRLWCTLTLIRVLRLWPRGCLVLRFLRRRRLTRWGWAPWLAVLRHRQGWHGLRRKRQLSVAFHVFRALFLWKCCALKSRKRAARHFRTAEGHLHPFAVPHEHSPPPRNEWTRRVPHPVLIGHAASLTP
jgi:hypothetical protein